MIARNPPCTAGLQGVLEGRTMDNYCNLARQCPYFIVEWNRAKNKLMLACKGEWGRTCLIWQEQDTLSKGKTHDKQ